MRKIKLTKDERAIEERLEQLILVDKQEYEQIVQAIVSRRKNAVLNIRVNRSDLNSIKHKAHKLGIKYQTFVSEILHKAAQT